METGPSVALTPVGAKVSAQWLGRAAEGGSSGASQAPEKPAWCRNRTGCWGEERRPGHAPHTCCPGGADWLGPGSPPERKGAWRKPEAGRVGFWMKEGFFKEQPLHPCCCPSPAVAVVASRPRVPPASEILQLSLPWDFCPPRPVSSAARLWARWGWGGACRPLSPRQPAQSLRHIGRSHGPAADSACREGVSLPDPGTEVAMPTRAEAQGGGQELPCDRAFRGALALLLPIANKYRIRM